MKKLETLKKKMLADPAVRKAYDDLAPEYELVRKVIKERVRAEPGRSKSRGELK